MVRHQYPATRVYVFARSREEQAFARELGAAWAGDTNDRPPELLDAVIDTTPVWSPVVAALERLKPGGRLLLAEPPLHVTKKAFASELAEAEAAGFRIADRPRIRWAHAVVLAAEPRSA